MIAGALYQLRPFKLRFLAALAFTTRLQATQLRAGPRLRRNRQISNFKLEKPVRIPHKHKHDTVRQIVSFLQNLFVPPLPFNYEMEMLVYTCSATCRLSRSDSAQMGKSRRVEEKKKKNVENHKQQLNKCKQQDAMSGWAK